MGNNIEINTWGNKFRLYPLDQKGKYVCRFGLGRLVTVWILRWILKYDDGYIKAFDPVQYKAIVEVHQLDLHEEGMKPHWERTTCMWTENEFKERRKENRKRS